jgi:pyrroline-5-carboxylate reductase
MIGVIGCGNMAQAIVKGMKNEFQNLNFLTYTPTYTRAKSLAKDVQGRAVKELSEMAAADILIIACKPQQFNDLVQQLKGLFDLSQKHIVSIMASISIESIMSRLAADKVTRVMPNTPSLLQEGISLIYHNESVDQSERDKIEKYFSACSKIYPMESEKTFDEVTTITGSGPAYVFEFAKSLMKKNNSFGVDEGTSQEMIVQLFRGALALMEKNQDKPLQELIDQVTSKGGVTIEAIKMYREKELDHITSQAIDKAIARSHELSKDF